MATAERTAIPPLRNVSHHSDDIKAIGQFFIRNKFQPDIIGFSHTIEILPQPMHEPILSLHLIQFVDIISSQDEANLITQKQLRGGFQPSLAQRCLIGGEEDLPAIIGIKIRASLQIRASDG